MISTRTYTLTAVLALGALSAPLSAAPDAGSAAAPTSTPGSTADAGASETAASNPDAEPDLLEAGSELIAAVKQLRDKESSIKLRLKIAALTGAVITLLLAFLRRFPAIDKRKRWLPLAMLGLGVIGGVADQLATGVGWMAALTAAGPLLSQIYYQLAKQAKGTASQ